jgi:hypothetical protein
MFSMPKQPKPNGTPGKKPPARPGRRHPSHERASMTMPLEDRIREFDMALIVLMESLIDRFGFDENATVGRVLTVAEVETLAAGFYLVVTADGEVRDAL